MKKTIILTLATLLPAISAGARTFEEAGVRAASIGPVWPHPKASDALTCLGAPPRNSFMGAQAWISVEQGTVKALLRDTLGLSPDFKALALRLGLEDKHEVQASWDVRDCRVSSSRRWTCAGKARVELVGTVIQGEKASFDADALLVADQAQASLVVRQGGSNAVQTARFSAGECR